MTTKLITEAIIAIVVDEIVDAVVAVMAAVPVGARVGAELGIEVGCGNPDTIYSTTSETCFDWYEHGTPLSLGPVTSLDTIVSDPPFVEFI